MDLGKITTRTNSILEKFWNMYKQHEKKFPKQPWREYFSGGIIDGVDPARGVTRGGSIPPTILEGLDPARDVTRGLDAKDAAMVLIKLFGFTGLPSFIHSYGMKSVNEEFLGTVDFACQLCGSTDNVFDIRRSVS